jgi:hypothetical protein
VGLLLWTWVLHHYLVPLLVQMTTTTSLSNRGLKQAQSQAATQQNTEQFQ